MKLRDYSRLCTLVCPNCGTEMEMVMDRREILSKMQAGEISLDEANALLAEIDAPKKGTLYCKVSQKGAVSVYGLQRMPVTLYVEQWERLLNFADDLRAFIRSHDAELKRKER